MQASKKFYNKCSENSRSQIIFRTVIFQKLLLGAPDLLSLYVSYKSSNEKLLKYQLIVSCAIIALILITNLL